MAKEQKAIAKLLDKDGITVDFWRFPIKNVDKIIGQVLELVGESRLGLSKDNLKNFDTFVIQTTEPNGTVIDTVFECSDVEFLDLVKEDYKDYFGYYPSEDKFDSERWSYILGGHKGYKESKKSARKSMKESKVDYQSVIDSVLPKEYANNKNAYKFALSCVESLYNEDEYDSDSAKVYFLNCYISDLFPSWVDELGEETMDALANGLYDRTMKWKDIDKSWFESKKSARKSMKESKLTRYDMIGKGFFVLIDKTVDSFCLCEQLGNKTQDTNVLRSFDTEKQARNYANKKGCPIVIEGEVEEIKESIDSIYASSDMVGKGGKEWLLEGSYNFIMEFLSNWGIAPFTAKNKGTTTYFYDYDGNEYGYYTDEDGALISITDEGTNYAWKNNLNRVSTKNVKVYEV